MLFALWVATLIAGCMERSRSDVTVTEDSYAESIAAAVCATAFRCCEVDEVEFILDEDTASTEEDCRARVSASVHANQAEVAALLASGTVRFDPAAASCHVSAWRGATCAQLAEREVSRSCGDSYVGTVALGESCANPYECAPIADGQTFCAEAEGMCRISYREVDVPLGGSCAAGSDPSIYFNCAEGTFCDGSVCVALRVNGGPCDEDLWGGEECASGACRAGSCVPRPTPLPEGAACASDGYCESRDCRAGVCAAAICDGR